MTQSVLEPTQYLVDANGHRTGVILSIEAWERLLMQVAVLALPETTRLVEVPEWAGTISMSPDVVWGEPVFANTRVPIQAFIDFIRAGDSLESFHENYPSVPMDVIDHVAHLLLQSASKSYAHTH